MKGGTVAVLDVGKSDVKLSASTNEGHVLETLTLPNRVLPGPPWQHHDLAAWRVALNWLALNYPVSLMCPPDTGDPGGRLRSGRQRQSRQAKP